MRASPLCAVPLAALLALPQAAPANPLDAWHLFGANTMRAEHYEVRGDRAGSPYRFEGPQAFDEFSFNLNRRDSPYDLWRAQLYGVANASEYRSTDRGLVPERVNLFREDGDAAMPYRAEVGDYFGFFSFRTLQRSLKGAQIELQPFADASGPRHSVLLLTGANQPSWRHFQPSDDYSNGLSWLVEDAGLGRYSLNLVHNLRAPNTPQGVLERSQAVGSLAGEGEIPWGAHRFRLESELAGLSGDHDGVNGAASGQDRKDTGVFLQLSRRGPDPLTLRLRFERYGRDFRPSGAVITPDRRSAEGHLGWRFTSGLAFRGRAQTFRDGLQSGNPTDTHTFGVNLAGPLFQERVAGLTGSVDAFTQDQERRDSSLDRRLYTASVNLSKPFGAWTGRVGAFLQRLENFTASPGSTTQQYTVSADRALELLGFRGVVTPGLLYRRVAGGAAATRDWSPTLALSLARGAHLLRANLSLLDQNPKAAGAADVGTGAASLEYRYSAGAHTFGLELNLIDRAPSPGADTGSYRVSAFWTYSFDRPPRIDLARRPLTGAPLAPTGPVGPGAGLLLHLSPGSDLERSLSRLAAAGIVGGAKQPGGVVYEVRVLEEIDQRQRLALLHEAGEITLAALIVEFEDVGNRDSVSQTFERVRRALLQRFGNPAFALEEGEFRASFAADVNSGRFVRIMEWPTESGWLRLGIPRRLDGQVRIEVQHARGFPPPGDTLWSLEAVR